MKRFLKKITPKFIINLYHRLRSRLRPLEINLKILLHLPLKKKREKIKFEIHLVEHCNLNCASCDNFSPLAEPEFISVEEFKKDFERLGNLFNHETERIYLLGGEPLLHPDLLQLMKISRENFTSGEIDVYTNGLLLLQQSKEFWETLRDYNIGLYITCYPVNIDHEKIKALAKEYGIYINWWRENDIGKEFKFMTRPLLLNKTVNYKKNFVDCYKPNWCIMLSHGKLYTCSSVPCIRHFNKFFKQNIPVTEKDYIDIYEAPDGEYILKKLIEPTPVCGYCDLAHVRYGKWHQSERKISEWT